VVGHFGGKAPKLVEKIAAKLAKGDLSGSQRVATPDGNFVVVKLDDKAWLVGGEAWRLLGCEIVSQARAAGADSVSVPLEGSRADAQSLVEGALLGDYRYLASRSGKAAKRSALVMRVPGHKAAVAQGNAVAAAQNFARTLADAPGNVINPQTFLTVVKKELRGTGLTLNVISGIAALKKAGFPGLVQVGMAGSAPPALLQIVYKPKKVKSKAKLALVGKGITFDTGGISLKPGAQMWEMKGDMGGAAAVVGAMRIIASTKPSVPVTAYCALAENMPDSEAQRPGDIYKARNGKFIHVDNTDAEGRLVLADVLTYACEKGATHIVDVATLTGACLVALGDNIAAVLGRHDAWNQTVRAAGQDVGEEFWPLPLYGEYRRLLDHPHADINNIGGRWGGTITAGIFLSEFVDEKVQWAHCDIAGPAMQSGGWRYYTKGMTGFAARTLARIAQNL
jgi:leucyl aminopeptidase